MIFCRESLHVCYINDHNIPEDFQQFWILKISINITKNYIQRTFH